MVPRQEAARATTQNGETPRSRERGVLPEATYSPFDLRLRDQIRV